MAVNKFAEAINFLNCNIKAGIADQDLQPLLQSGFDNLISALNHESVLTYDQGTACITALGDSPFNMAMRIKLIHLINGLAASSGTLATIQEKRPPLQSHMYFHRYLAKREWNALADESIALQLKVDVVANKANLLGLVFVTEQTLVHMVATMMLAMKNDGNLNVQPKDAWALLQEVKRSLRVRRSKARLAHYGKVTAFPELPATFAKEWPEIYNGAFPVGSEPAECPLNEMMLEYLRQQLPARKTHNSIAISIKNMSRSFGHPMALRYPWQDMQVDLPGFRMLTPQRQALPGSSPLPIADRLESPQLSPEPPQRELEQAVPERMVPEPSPVASTQALPTSVAAKVDGKSVEEMSSALIAKLTMKSMKAVKVTKKARAMKSVKGKKVEAKAMKAKATSLKAKAMKLDEGGSDSDGSTDSDESPAPAAKVLAMKAKGGGKDALKYPGVPKKPAGPKHHGQMVIYTDLKNQKWRVRREGERQDKAFSWKLDAKASWTRLLERIAA